MLESIEPIALPFSYAFARGDTAWVAVRGLLRWEPDRLVFEFRLAETSFSTGRTRSGEIRSVSVPLAEIQAAEYRKRWFGRRSLVLRTRGLHALAELPNVAGNEVSLRIARADEHLARELVANLELARAEECVRGLAAPEPPWNRPSA